MPFKAVSKTLFVKYKAIERTIFRVDKHGEKENYIKLKYQFRMIFTLCVLAMLLSISLLILHREFLPAPFPALACVLIGFRFKCYSVPRMMVFITMTVIPLRDLHSDLILAVPAAILYCNVQMLIISQSEFYTLMHLTLQTLIMYFYGVEKITQRIQAMTPEEIVKITQAAIYVCIGAAWVNLITVQRFYAHVSNLLRKIGALRDNLSRANNQLNEQNLKLQNNLEMKDIFIYTFSHELKNALNGLLGNLTLAYDTARDTQLIQFLSSARVCGEVLKNFVHNILDSGKLENGNLEVSPERKDVMGFMEKVWAVCGRIIENKRLQGFLEVEKNVPRYLELDEQRMIQIILNLASNACKFTEKGYVRIHISWQTTSSSKTQLIHQDNEEYMIKKETEEFGDMREFRDTSQDCLLNREQLHLVTGLQKKFITDSQVYQLTPSKWNWNREEVLPSNLVTDTKGILKVQVLDTGCGMSPEDQAKLFQKFSQTNKIAGQRKVGTGLGLWICKELAKGLDGDIKVRSVVGVGSTFELIVHTTVSPAIEKPYTLSALSQNSDCSPELPLQKRKKPNTKKILIADDDNFNVELMKNYLNKFAIGYICAYDGEEAISLFKRHYEDICFVIIDNFMPKKTGIEAAVEIKAFLKEARKPNIPIMCISGDVKVNVGEGGVTCVIQKPINFDRLKEELMTIYPQMRP
mgnify:CR=1 FL=1